MSKRECRNEPAFPAGFLVPSGRDGPESELAAIVVVERLVDHQQDAFAESIGLVRIRTGGRVLGEHRLKLQAQTPRVIDEEAAIRAEAGVKCEPEQSLLSARFDLGSDVEERRGDESAILDDADSSALLEDKQASAAVVGNFHPGR